MKIWCDTCKHSKVCLGKSLYKQFKAEVDNKQFKTEVGNMSDKHTEFEEWFKVDVRCKHYLAQNTLR